MLWANYSKYRRSLSVRLSQSNYFKTLEERSNKQLLASFVKLLGNSSLSAERQQKSLKSYQLEFPSVIVLRCFMKGATSSSFRRILCAQLTISREQVKMHCLGKFFQALITFIRRLCRSSLFYFIYYLFLLYKGVYKFIKQK